MIYALNVDDPANPIFLWKKTEVDIPELGYTWSAPKAARVRGYANPVLIFGGGYDNAEDSEPPLTNTMGRGIFILDATNGTVVWQASYSGSGGTTCAGTNCALSGMTHSIPADVTLVNRDFDTNGYIDRIYAADMGGNIWRVDLEPAGYTAAASPSARSTWQVTKFASLGGTGDAAQVLLPAGRRRDEEFRHGYGCHRRPRASAVQRQRHERVRGGQSLLRAEGHEDRCRRDRRNDDHRRHEQHGERRRSPG